MEEASVQNLGNLQNQAGGYGTTGVVGGGQTQDQSSGLFKINNFSQTMGVISSGFLNRVSLNSNSNGGSSTKSGKNGNTSGVGTVGASFSVPAGVNPMAHTSTTQSSAFSGNLLNATTPHRHTNQNIHGHDAPPLIGSGVGVGPYLRSSSLLNGLTPSFFAPPGKGNLRQ